MSNLAARYVRDGCGATAVEYALVALLIATALIVGVEQLGASMRQTFENIQKAYP